MTEKFDLARLATLLRAAGFSALRPGGPTTGLTVRVADDVEIWVGEQGQTETSNLDGPYDPAARMRAFRVIRAWRAERGGRRRPLLDPDDPEDRRVHDLWDSADIWLDQVAYRVNDNNHEGALQALREIGPILAELESVIDRRRRGLPDDPAEGDDAST